MRKVSILLVLAMLSAMLCVSPLSVFAEDAGAWDGSIAEGFAGGSGTEADPYLISDGSQLAYLAKTVNDGESYFGTSSQTRKYFKLTSDIDLGNLEWTPIGKGLAYGTYDNPVNPFSGIFDGDGHVISNVKITQLGSHSLGLFGGVKNANIKNVGIDGMTVEISNVTDSSKRINDIGGIVGFLHGTVSGCFVKNISIKNINYGCSEGYVGGIAGSVNSWSSIYDSYVDGMKWSGSYNSMMGGITAVCRSDNNNIARTYTKNISIDRPAKSYNDNYANRYFNMFCYTPDKVTAAKCYYTDFAFASEKNGGEYKTPGEFAAGGAALLGSAFSADENGGAPVLGWQAKKEVWDGSIAEGFAGGTGAADDPYLISDGSQLAYLAQRVNGGENFGDENGANVNYFKLTADIDLGNAAWTPIGSVWLNLDNDGYAQGNGYTDGTEKPFGGIFDGDGHVIKNLKFTGKDFSGNQLKGTAGLFGYIKSSWEGGYKSTGGVIKNLGVENVKFEYTNSKINYHTDSVGGIVGASYCGRISGCFVKNVSKTLMSGNTGAYFGGILGIALRSTSWIDNSYVNGYSTDNKWSVGSGGMIGGIGVGREAYVSGCYVSNISFNGASAVWGYDTCVSTWANSAKGAFNASNSYYSDCTPSGTADNVKAFVKAESADLKAMTNVTLGGMVCDTKNVNGGYPCFAWELAKAPAEADADAINKAYADEYADGIILAYITKKGDGTVKSDLIFAPAETYNVTYTFDNTSVLADVSKDSNGLYTSKLTRPSGEGTTDVKITASVTVGTQTSSKEFTIAVENRADAYEINRVFWLDENNSISDVLTADSIKAVVESDSASDKQDASVYLALYNADGSLEKVLSDDYADDITFDIENAGTDRTFKAFIWTKADIKPLAKAY